MKGFNYVTVQNRPCVIEYKGEHYVVRHQFRARIDGIADALLYAIEIYKTVKESDLK